MYIIYIYKIYIYMRIEALIDPLSIICGMHSVARLFHEYWKAPQYTAALHSVP